MVDRVLIHVRPWNSELALLTGKALAQQFSTEVVFCSMFAEAVDFIRHKGERCHYLLKDMLSIERDDIVSFEERFERIDRELVARKGYGLSFMLAAERFKPINGMSDFEFMIRHVYVLDQLISNATLAVSFTLEHFVYWLSAELVSLKGGSNFSFIPSGVPQNRVMGLKDPYQFWTFQSEENAVDLLEMNRLKLAEPPGSRLVYMKPVKRPNRIRRLKSIRKKRKFRKVDKQNGSYFLQDQYSVSKQDKILYRLLGAPSASYSSLESLPSRFYYFPLHLDPEMTVNIYSPYYSNQLEVCKLIAQSLPVDCYLLVKENPKMAGKREISFYKKLKALPNTALVASDMSSIELIKKAEITFSLSGTAAFEAGLLGQRSIIFGKPPQRELLKYHSCGDVWKIEDLPRLMNTVWEPDFNTDKAWNRIIAGSLAVNLIPKWLNDNEFGVQGVHDIVPVLVDFIVRSTDVVS